MAARILSARWLAVFAVVHEVLTDSSACHRSKVLQRSSISCRSGNDDGLVECAVLFECFCNVSNSGCLLTNRNVNADHVVVTLVDDRVERDRRLTSLAVANDKLTLTTSDRNHRVDRDDTGLHRLFNGLTLVNARCLEFNRAITFSLDRAFAVDRHTERIHNTTEHCVTGRNLQNLTSGAHLVIFLDCREVTKENSANLFFFEVLS